MRQRRTVLRGAAVALALVLTAASTWGAERLGPTAATDEMEVMGVQVDRRSGAPMVLLRGKRDKRELAMFIGPFEAQAIAIPLQGITPPRPYTHDLMLAMLHRLHATVKRVVITDLRDNTYYADLVLDVQGQELLLDSRPSDAIALALRENAPILVTEAVFGKAPGTPAPGAGPRGTP